MVKPKRSEAEWKAWIASVEETALEPDRAICDAHHHLWLDEGHTGWPYTLTDLHKDTTAGHNIVRTVYLECGAEYDSEGPEHLRPVGETRFAAAQAELSADSGKAEIAAIIGHADLRLGDAVEEVILAHEEAGRGRFRGIRYVTAQSDHPPLAMRTSARMDDEKFRDGVRKLGGLGHSFDAMVYHPQLSDLVELALACPDTTIVINHLGGFLGTGPYRGRHEEVLEAWYGSMDALAQCANTFLKVGGIGMPMMGHRWDKLPRPPGSEALAEPWLEPMRRVIERFGPHRCMFESNYPVDMMGAGYVILWNAFKRIAADYSEADKRNLFHDTAARAYRLPLLV